MILHAVVVMASDGPNINANGIIEWGVKNLIPLILLAIGIGIIASARQGRISENAGTLSNVLIGMCVIAGAFALYGFAGQLVDVIFGG